MPYGNTLCYLHPGKGGIRAFIYPQSIKAGILDLATPEGCKAELTVWAWLHTEVIYPPEDGNPSQY